MQDWRHKNRKEPVLILTARGDVDQRIAGLNSGADDYLGKPFALKEVQARLNALIRRSGGQAAPVIRHGKSNLIRRRAKFAKTERKRFWRRRNWRCWNCCF